VVSCMALVSSSTHLSIAPVTFTTVFHGSLSAREAWNAGQYVRVKSGQSSTFRKGDRQVVSIMIGR
jgi:hypothetical protein